MYRLAHLITPICPQFVHLCASSTEVVQESRLLMILANCLLTTMFFMQALVKTLPKSVSMACNLHNDLSLFFF